MTEANSTAEISLPPVNPPEVDHKKNSSKSFQNLPTSEQLMITHRILQNTNNPNISEVMSRFGFDQKKMSLLSSYYDEAVVANDAQSKEYGESTDAYNDFLKLFQTAKSDFSTMRKVARVALKKNPGKLVDIKVDQQKKQTINGLLEQMQVCYDNILADREVLQKMAEFGISEETIYGYQKNYQQSQVAYNQYYKENSEAADATRNRDEKIDAICDFLSDFFAISKIAFADKPDLLSQIS